MKYFSFFIIAVAIILLPQIAKAECLWTSKPSCSDMGNYWYPMSDIPGVFCAAPKLSGATVKCCCAAGCCRYAQAVGLPAVIKYFSDLASNEATCTSLVVAKGAGYSMSSFEAQKIPDGQGGCEDRPSTGTSGSGASSGATGSGGSSGATGSGGAALQSAQYPNPLGTIDIRVVIGRIVRAILLFVGAVALIAFVYGGFTWLTSAGNESKVETGRTTLIWASIGLIIVFSAYVLVKYVMEAVGSIG